MVESETIQLNQWLYSPIWKSVAVTYKTKISLSDGAYLSSGVGCREVTASVNGMSAMQDLRGQDCDD